MVADTGKGDVPKNTVEIEPAYLQKVSGQKFDFVYRGQIPIPPSCAGPMDQSSGTSKCARSLGLRWNPYQGIYDGHGVCRARAREEEIFAVLKLDFVPPEFQEIQEGGAPPGRLLAR